MSDREGDAALSVSELFSAPGFRQERKKKKKNTQVRLEQFHGIV